MSDVAPAAPAEVTPATSGPVSWPTSGPRFDLPRSTPPVVDGAPRPLGWIPRHDLPAITADGKTVVHVEESVAADGGYALELVWRHVSDGTAVRRQRVHEIAPGAPSSPDAALGARLEQANALLAREPLTPMRPMEADESSVTLFDRRIVMAASLRADGLVIHDSDFRYDTIRTGFEPAVVAACPTGGARGEPDCGCELRPRMTGGGWSAEHRVVLATAQMEAPHCTSSLPRVALAVVPTKAPYVATQPPPYLETPTLLPAPYQELDYEFVNWPVDVGLPAISADSKTVAWVDSDPRRSTSFIERRDVARDKVVERFQIVGRPDDSPGRDEQAFLRVIAERVASINTSLAASRWDPLVHVPGIHDDFGAPQDSEQVAPYGKPDVFVLDSGTPRVRVSFEGASKKLTVALDDKEVYAQLHESWGRRSLPCEPGSARTCPCEFDPSVYVVYWSPEHRLLWMWVGSSTRQCEVPGAWVTVRLPAGK